jgi:hypothetical protein
MNTEKLVQEFVIRLREAIEREVREEVEAAVLKAIGSGGGRVARKPIGVGGKRAKRTPEEMARQATRLHAFVKANPGLRMEQIVEGMKLDTALLAPLAKRLVDEKKLKAKGKARGTTYTAA